MKFTTFTFTFTLYFHVSNSNISRENTAFISYCHCPSQYKTFRSTKCQCHFSKSIYFDNVTYFWVKWGKKWQDFAHWELLDLEMWVFHTRISNFTSKTAGTNFVRCFCNYSCYFLPQNLYLAAILFYIFVHKLISVWG